jgi:flagellar biosynthesis/type III secretory pathway protein FliH
MIIKRKQAGQLIPQTGDNLASGKGESVEDSLNWNPDTITSGLVDDRRQSEKRSDRRRGYRRIEDRDLISKAHEEANAIRENAQNQGFQEGLDQARDVVEELRNAITNLVQVREESLLSVTNEIAALSVEVAARIIKTEVSCDDTLVMSLVRDTIQKAGRNTKTILIKVNPDDSAIVKKMLKDEPIPNLHAELIVMDETTVDAGSCIIETNSGLIDASFSTQMGILRQLFSGGSRDRQ